MSISIKHIRNQEDMASLLAEVGLAGDLFIVKPSWFSPHYGNYTEAAVLDLVLGALPGRKMVVEGYSGARNDGSREITPENAREHWAWIRDQDRWFLESTGIGAVLARRGVEYLNVTEEVWQGRIADPATIAALVEARYPGVVRHRELFAAVPKRLFDLRGTPLISLARLKTGSFALKNLFGLIPDPIRLPWHEYLGEAIVEIVAIYGSLFPTVGVVEGIYRTTLYREGGYYHTPWGDYDVMEGPGIALAGRDLVALDASAFRLLGLDPEERTF
ncbi:MAG: DUF362 domain-containing protein, partial [Chloroflexota bacterium]